MCIYSSKARWNWDAKQNGNVKESRFLEKKETNIARDWEWNKRKKNTKIKPNSGVSCSWWGQVYVDMDCEEKEHTGIWPQFDESKKSKEWKERAQCNQPTITFDWKTFWKRCKDIKTPIATDQSARFFYIYMMRRFMCKVWN